MTTIAYKNGSLCCDSLISQNSVRVGAMQKIFQTEEFAYGCAGAAGICTEFNAFMQKQGTIQGYHEKYGKEYGKDETNLSVLMINKSTKELTHYSYGTNATTFTAEYSAIGSGVEIALGVMACGKSAREAIKVAIKLDCLSGGKIQEIKF